MQRIITHSLPVTLILLALPAVAAIQFTDASAFQAALVQSATIDWDDVTVDDGSSTTIGANHYAALFGSPELAMTGDRTNLYIVNPNSSLLGNDFIPVSGENVFSPTLPPSPEGKLTITFDQEMHGIGAYFLDVEGDHAVTGIKVNDLFYNFASNQGDNSQSFLGVIDSAGFLSADIYMAFDQGAVNGVGIDDVVYGQIPAPGAALLGLLGCGAISVLRRRNF